jgi:hypothetical protein
MAAGGLRDGDWGVRGKDAFCYLSGGRWLWASGAPPESGAPDVSALSRRECQFQRFLPGGFVNVFTHLSEAVSVIERTADGISLENV